MKTSDKVTEPALRKDIEAALSKADRRMSRIKVLKVHDLEADRVQEFSPGNIPDKHLWAYRHIITHECGSLSCGKTVYEVTYMDVMA